MQVFFNTYRQGNKLKSKILGLLRGSEPMRFMLDGENFDQIFQIKKHHLFYLNGIQAKRLDK
jgi:hypothetical protein